MSGHKLTTLKVNRLAAAQITQARIMAAMRDEQNMSRSAEVHRQNAIEMEAVFLAIERRQALFEESLDDYQNEVIQNLERETCRAIHSQHEELYENLQGMFDSLWIETGEVFSGALKKSNEAQHHVQEMADVYQETLETLETRQEIQDGLHADLQRDLDQLRREQGQLAGIFEENQKRIARTFQDVHDRQIALSDNQSRILHDLGSVTQYQQRFAQQEAVKVQLVQERLAEAATLSQFIIQTYDHDRFAPGQVQSCLREFGQAEQNLHDGFLDGAMVTAQTLYQQLSELRSHLQQDQAEWEMLVQSVRNRLSEIQTMAGAMVKISSMDLDGNDIGEKIDVDYWSSRKFSRLITMIHYLRERIEKDPAAFKTDELRWIQENQLPEIVKEMQDTCTLAAEEALNSQLRINIADLVIQALENQGFVLSKAQYEQNDQRRSFQANVVNLAGDEIIIGVEPNKSEKSSSHLHLFSLDADQRSEHELRHRAEEVVGSLARYGIETGEIKVLPEMISSSLNQHSPVRITKRTKQHYNE
jgi:hypothetical protein